jgi:transposase
LVARIFNCIEPRQARKQACGWVLNQILRIKVHLGVDINGLPRAVRVTRTGVAGCGGTVETLRNCAPNLSKVANVLCDGGYGGKNFVDAVKMLIGAEVEVVKRNELHTFAVLPKRWVVERTFEWRAACCIWWIFCA